MKTNKRYYRLYALAGVTVVSAGLAFQACSGSGSGGSVSLGVTTPAPTGAAQFQVGVYQPGNAANLVANGNVAEFVAGATFTVNATSTVAGSMSMTCTDTDIPTETSITTTLSSGANTVPVPAPGDYTCVISQQGVTGAAQFDISVTCANSTALDLSGVSITATAAGSDNLFNFSASGISGGTGTGYLCAWDFLGDGIQDTAVFTKCSPGPQGVYVPYVGSHRVGLLVRDSCNTAGNTYSAPINFGETTPPAMGAANVFIFGVVSNPTGSASSDTRVTQPTTGGITYLATNQGPSNETTVVANLSAGTTTSGFEIKSSLQYAGPSSTAQGADFNISGIPGTLDAATMTDTIGNGSGTLPMNVSFTTDDAGDAEPAVTYQGNCNLAAQWSSKVVQGVPCTNGTTGDQNQPVVEVWGSYACTLTAPNGATITLTGELDGLYNTADSCIGGSGQEGGGNPTPGF